MKNDCTKQYVTFYVGEHPLKTASLMLFTQP